MLLPIVETAEQARQLDAATRYPPQGIGSALARASHWISFPDYMYEADAQICLLVRAFASAEF